MAVIRHDEPVMHGGGLDYVALAARVRGSSGSLDVAVLAEAVMDTWAAAYREECMGCQLLEFHEQGASFLFDLVEEPKTDRQSRTVAGYALSQATAEVRDEPYQRNYPSPTRHAMRPLDKGHMIPHAVGGQFGPNIFPQDRALNRGWSLEGRKYRTMEQRAAATPGTFFFCRLLYVDDTAFPACVELGLLQGKDLVVERFRNRFDITLPYDGRERDGLARLRSVLTTSTSRQVGDLGEETVAVYLETALDATIVALGDSGMPRYQQRQDLDIVAVVEGELVVFEVKTTYFGRAGRLTAAGNLPRPRLRRQRRERKDGQPSPRQGSQDYAAARLATLIDIDEGFLGVQARAVAVDLSSLVLQQFYVDDAGRITKALGEPVDCSQAALTALDRILEHRGFL